MRHILVLFLVGLVFACSGGSHSSTPPAPPASTTVAAAIPAGTYTAKHSTGSASILDAAGAMQQPLGNIAQTVIVGQYGGSLMELSGWNLVNAVITALPDGTLQVGSNPTLTDVSGTTSPLTLTGTMSGGEMTGTVNGGLAFDVVLTSLQNTPIDLTTKAGTWISSSSSTGQVLRITVPSVLGQSYNITIDAYANSADATAKVNVLGQYSGTMNWTSNDVTHSLNLFRIGFGWTPAGGSLASGDTAGLAYFDASGNFVMLTMVGDNGQTWPKQVSAVFMKE